MRCTTNLAREYFTSYSGETCQGPVDRILPSCLCFLYFIMAKKSSQWTGRLGISICGDLNSPLWKKQIKTMDLHCNLILFHMYRWRPKTINSSHKPMDSIIIIKITGRLKLSPSLIIRSYMNISDILGYQQNAKSFKPL